MNKLAASAALETCADGVVVLDAAGHIVDVNDSFCRMVGEAADALRGRQFSSLETSADDGVWRERLSDAATRGPSSFEGRLCRPDGEVGYFELALSHHHDSAQWFVFCRDVSRRKWTEALLSARERIARLGVSGSLDEVIQATLDSAEAVTGSTIGFLHFVEDNQRDLTLQCWSTNTLRNMCAAEGKGAHYPIDSAGVWVDCMHTRAPVIHNDYASLPHKKGLPEGHAPVIRELVLPVMRGDRALAIIGVGNKPSPYTEHDVEMVQTLASLCIDLVGRQRAEEQLRQSEEQFRHLYESTSHGVVYRMADGTILAANPAALRILGLSLDQLRDGSAQDPRALAVREDGSTLPVDENPAIVALRTGEPVRGVVMGVFNPVLARRRWLRVDAIPRFRPGEPRPWQVFAVFEDISPEREATENRLELERRIQQIQKLESLQAVTGGIAHDFNNIFTAALGHLELAITELEDDSVVREDLIDAKAAITRAAQLSKQMLAASGATRLTTSNTTLREVVMGQLVSLLGQMPKSLSLEYVHGEQASISADVPQLHRVIEQLVTNAREAMSEPGPAFGGSPRSDREGTILVVTGLAWIGDGYLDGKLVGEPLAPGRYATLAVTDAGHGMDAGTLSRVFDPFFSTRFTGRGLGMPEALGIVRAHKGAMSIESAPGQGTTVRMFLPITSLATHPEPSRSTSSRPGGKRVVLLVDDEESIALIGKRVLERAGYVVLLAPNGRRALEIFAENRASIRLVILDVSMPDMSGVEVLEQLRAQAPDLAVLMSSGYTEQSLEREMGSLKAEGFLPKPYDSATLLEAVRRVLSRPLV